jgi:hypothetical protein
MSIARIVEISSTSEKSFENAIEQVYRSSVQNTSRNQGRVDQRAGDSG